MADDIKAGSLTVDIEADTKKLDAALNNMKAKIDGIENDVVEVEVESGELKTAGQRAEELQGKIGKVLGIIGGFVAAVQVIGGVGLALRNAAREGAGLLSEAEASKSSLRNFSESIPVIGALGIAIEDLAMGLGFVDDAVLEVEKRLAAAEAAAKRFTQALTGERAVEDFKRQLMELQGATELQILEAGLDPVTNQLDDQIQTVKDTIREAQDELNRLSASGAGSVGRTGDPALERQFDEQLETLKQLKRDLNELAALRPQIIEEREAAVRGAEIEAIQAKRAKVDADREAAIAERDRMEEEAAQKRIDETKELSKKQEERDKKAQERQDKIATATLTKEKERLIAVRNRIKEESKTREGIRSSLGSTQQISTAVGAFTIGRTFSPMDSSTRIQSQIDAKVGKIDGRLGLIESLLRAIERKGGVSGVFT